MNHDACYHALRNQRKQTGKYIYACTGRNAHIVPSSSSSHETPPSPIPSSTSLLPRALSSLLAACFPELGFGRLPGKPLLFHGLPLLPQHSLLPSILLAEPRCAQERAAPSPPTASSRSLASSSLDVTGTNKMAHGPRTTNAHHRKHVRTCR